MSHQVWGAFLGATVLILAILSRKQSRYRLPPSPPCDPIIGHTRQIPLEYSWKTFSSWRKTFGDVVYLHIFGRPMIIINSVNIARDLFDTRGSNFSDRPHLVVINDLMGMGPGLPLLPQGDRWRKQRRILQRYFDSQGVKAFKPVQEQEVQAFICDLFHDPLHFAQSVERLASRLVTKIVYGYQTLGKHDLLLERFAYTATLFTQFGEAGGSIIDLLPFLSHLPAWAPEWFPGASVKRHAIHVRALLDEIKGEFMKDLISKRALGSSNSCFLSKIFDDYGLDTIQDPELEADIQSIGLITSMAGFDTTACAVLTFFLMMTLHPEVVKQAQSQIDAVIGFERYPTLDDRGKLPYIDCIVREIYRIHPVTPINIPHLSVEVSHYGEFTIPAKTSCVANIWGMMHDENNFQDPHLFKPERHQGAEKELSELKDKDPSNIIFGFGRRICPGRFYADANIWLIIANVLAVYDIGPFVEPSTGEKVYPEAEFQPHLVSGPKPFKCNITPRSAEHERLIRQEIHDHN